MLQNKRQHANATKFQSQISLDLVYAEVTTIAHPKTQFDAGLLLLITKSLHHLLNRTYRFH